MKWLMAWLEQLGVAGVVGLGVLIFCVPFYVSALQPLQRELDARRGAAERLTARSPAQPVSTASGGRAGELRRFYGLFPPVEGLAGELARLYALAGESKLDLRQGEYRLESPGAGLLAYRVTLPVRGSYEQIRNFVGAALRDMPIASVDALRFERKKAGDTQLDAQIRLTVFFRPAEDVDER